MVLPPNRSKAEVRGALLVDWLRRTGGVAADGGQRGSFLNDSDGESYFWMSESLPGAIAAVPRQHTVASRSLTRSSMVASASSAVTLAMRWPS